MRGDYESNGDEDGADPSSKTLYAGYNLSGLGHNQEGLNFIKAKASAKFNKEVLLLATTRIGGPSSNFASPREGVIGGLKKVK